MAQREPGHGRESGHRSGLGFFVSKEAFPLVLNLRGSGAAPQGALNLRVKQTLKLLFNCASFPGRFPGTGGGLLLPAGCWI